jgi:hypothetical protein
MIESSPQVCGHSCWYNSTRAIVKKNNYHKFTRQIRKQALLNQVQPLKKGTHAEKKKKTML